MKAVEHQARKLGGEWRQEFTEVDLSATFSGTTIRQMAIDTGLKSLYDHEYQTSSAVTHGEWSPIEDYIMQRCMNPTHRWHLVPSPRPVFASEPQLGAYWVAKLGELVSAALRNLNVPRRHVRVMPNQREAELGAVRVLGGAGEGTVLPVPQAID